MKSADEAISIEWPEDDNEADSKKATDLMIRILSTLVDSRLKSADLVYVVIPFPVRDKPRLCEEVASTRKPVIFKSIGYGHKDRGAAFFLKDTDSLKAGIPLFFKHKPESLIIGAVDCSSSDSSSEAILRSIAESIMLRDRRTPHSPEFVGLVFDCDRLVEIF